MGQIDPPLNNKVDHQSQEAKRVKATGGLKEQ